MFAASCGSSTAKTAASTSPPADATPAGTTPATTGTTENSASSGLPTAFVTDTPLTKKPAASKKVGWLECTVPACQIYGRGFKDATKALGWDVVTIPLDQTGPASAFQQAIDAKVDFIVSTAQSAPLITEQLAAAKAAGIPFFSLFSDDVPNPSVNNIYIQAGGADFYTSQGSVLAKWVTKDSGGAGNVVYVNIRDLKILNYAEKGLGDTLKADCKGCSFDVLPVTFADLGGGKVPQLVASYLQKNPKTNYVLFAFSDLVRGVSDTLKSAGLDAKVKLGGTIADGQNTKAIADGVEAGWTAQAVDYMSWLAVDAMARYSVGMPLDKTYLDALSVVPTFVITKDTASQLLKDSDGLWTGPAGFREHLTKLWGV